MLSFDSNNTANFDVDADVKMICMMICLLQPPCVVISRYCVLPLAMFHHGAWLIISCGGVRKFHTNNSLLVAATTLPAYASFNDALSPSRPSHAAAMVDECLRGYQDSAWKFPWRFIPNKYILCSYHRNYLRQKKFADFSFKIIWECTKAQNISIFVGRLILFCLYRIEYAI